MQILPQKLEKLLSKARASGLILLRGDQVVYSAGGLSDMAIDTLRDALQRNWPEGDQQEFNRIVGMHLDDQFYLIFAKYLSPGSDLLGLVFPMQTPLIRIRQDMTDILRSIIENPSEEISGKQALEQSLQFRVKPTPRPDRVYPQVQMGWRPEQERQVAQDEETAVPEETNRTSSEGNPTESGSRKRYLTFGAPIGHSSIQGDPLKDPEAALENAPWQPIDEGWVPGSEQPSAQPEESNGQANPFSPTFSAMSDTAETGGDLVSLLHEGLQQKKGMDVIDDEEPAVRDFVLEENEHYRKSPDEKDPLESDQTSDDQWDEQVSDITFYLVPRFDEHHLIGELSQQLKSWMRIICMKYGWELILLSVRPDYLKWTLGDFPESLIQEMLRLMRMETSKRIFRTFSDLQNENQGGDYWAPGYLVDLQNREFTTQALMAHVDSSRLNTRKEKTK